MSERFNGGLHRRRFVQDGDIPVTVLRRDQGHELPAHRGAPAAAAPTSSRLQRVEAALASETTARERIERSLAESQAVVHDLQTKIGHAELAKIEALDALRREREAASQLRTDAHAWEARLEEAASQARATEQAMALCQDQLAEERLGRRNAEKALRAAESAREAAEQLVRALSEDAPQRSEPSHRVRAETEAAAPAQSRRQRMPELPLIEPEPVKWWLTTKPAAKRR
jgi:chromosome segregation ATPase